VTSGHRVTRLLAASLAGAMLLALLPAGAATADVITIDDVESCWGTEGLFEFDDDLGFWGDHIECMAAYGITQGFPDGTFRAGAAINRQQMALFIARLAAQALDGDLEIPTSTEDAFDDIAAINPPEARHAINWLAELGITTGVTADRYAPGGLVTRQQMASFIARAHVALGVDLPAASAPEVFGDIALIADVHRDNVLVLHAAGVVQGEAGGVYNPGRAVTRGQMAGFVVRSIGVLETQGLWAGQVVVSTVVNERTGVRYGELQAAIDAAEADDTLLVYGEHVGTAEVDRSLEILAIANAALRGSFWVTADAVTIWGFEITDFDTVQGELVGIYVADGVDDVEIYDNLILGDGADGSRGILATTVGGTASGWIEGNAIGAVTTGIFLQGEVDVEVLDNLVFDAETGIASDTSGAATVLVEANELVDNAEAIGLGGPGVEVVGNWFALDELDADDAVYVTDYVTTYTLADLLDTNDFDPEGEVVGDQIVPVADNG
jgi:hypothetical protein